MSHWTHIVAAIDIDTYHQDKNIKGYVENILVNAPKITGSERNADVFVNALSGYNCFTSCDCNSCEYKDTVKHYPDGYECAAHDGFRCPSGKYQTRVVITIIGDLRDREHWKTREEWHTFKEYVREKIGHGYEFRNCACRIHD